MNNFYVFYDEDKNIRAISTELESYTHFNYIAISETLATDFLTGKKFLENYFVKKNNFNVYTLEKKNTVNHKDIYSDIMKANKDYNSPFDLQIKIDSKRSQYVFDLSETFKEYINQLEYEKRLTFYIVKSEQHNWILNIVTLQLKDLIENTIFFDFKTSEETFDNIEIFTKKYFENIRLTQ